MKKKILFIVTLCIMLICMLAISVSAEVTTYDDAPERVNIEVREDDVAVFDDGFSCPSAYIFKDSKTTEAGAWSVGFAKATDFTYINGKTGKDYTFSNVVELDIPQGVTTVGAYSAYGTKHLKKVSFPDSVKTLGQSIFEGASGLEECVFEHDANDSLQTIPTYMFNRCSSLVAISLPDCITAIEGAYQFSGCSQLTAVHLPASLEVMEGGPQSAATFDGCKLMYFVNNPFTYDSIPEKPTTYYFPKNFNRIGDGCIFRSCNSLNQYLVFDEAMKSIPNLYTFENSANSTVVFLGVPEEIITGGWKTTNIIFANRNVVDDESAGLSRTGLDGSAVRNWDGTAYFCYAEGNTTHFAGKNVDTEATCVSNVMRTSYCFCGKEVETGEVEGTALGHSHTIYLGLIYEGFDKEGAYSYKCERCEDVNKDEVAPALFTCRGYSAPENGTGGIAIGFYVNNAAIAEYEEATDKTLKYGVFVVLKDRLGNNDVFGEDGTAAEGVINAEITNYEFVAFELKIVGFTDTQKDVKLAMGAYVAVTDGETTEYSYMQGDEPNENEKYCFVSYKDIVGAPSTDEEVTQ